MEHLADPHFSQFVSWGFYGLLSFVGWMGVSRLGSLDDSIRTLNEQIAVIINRVDTHEKRLDRHEEKIEQIQVIKDNLTVIKKRN